MIIYEAFNGGKNSRECKRPIKEPGRTRRPFERPLIVDTLDLSDRNLRLARVQRGRARARARDHRGPGNRSRWRSGKAVSRSVERVGYQWKFNARELRSRFDESEFPGKIESGHGPVSVDVITVRPRQRTRSNPERRNEQVGVYARRVCVNVILRLRVSVRTRLGIPLAERTRRMKRSHR